MAEVEKPSRVTQIPAAPGIKLENLIQFDGDCIDPLALVIITESLDYALEASARRLESLGKIFSGVEESAYASGKGILPTIKAVRDAILQAPQCTPEGPRVMPLQPLPEEAIIAEAKRRTAELAKPPPKLVTKAPPKPKPAPKTEIEAMIESLPKEVRQAAEAEYAKLKEAAKPVVKALPTGIGKDRWDSMTVEERVAAVKAVGLPGTVGSKAWGALTKDEQNALLAGVKEERLPKVPKAPKAGRALPELWGKAQFNPAGSKGEETELKKEWSSPGELAKALGIKVRGAKPDVVKAFTRAGFAVRGNGEEVEKGQTGFIVKRVAPTPVKYRLEKPEIEL